MMLCELCGKDRPLKSVRLKRNGDTGPTPKAICRPCLSALKTAEREKVAA